MSPDRSEIGTLTSAGYSTTPLARPGSPGNLPDDQPLVMAAIWEAV